MVSPVQILTRARPYIASQILGEQASLANQLKNAHVDRYSFCIDIINLWHCGVSTYVCPWPCINLDLHLLSIYAVHAYWQFIYHVLAGISVM